MPTPPLPNEVLEETLDAYRRHGTYEYAARELGIAASTMRDRIAMARKRGIDSSPGLREAVNRVDGGMDEARLAWRHDYDESGKKVGTVLLKRTEPEPADVAAEIAETMNRITPAVAAPAPEKTMGELLTVYPLMDVHLGMLAWGRETGASDYGTRIATEEMATALGHVLSWTPDTEEAILIIGGDFFHADDERAETPASKNSLDVDSRQFRVLEAGVQLLVDVMDRLLRKHKRVRVRVLRGNHDPHAHLVLTFALAQRYIDEPRAVVDRDPRDLFTAQWGRCLIAAHHGDRAKPEQLTLYISDVCPFWSETRHRYCFTGHVHHDRARDTGPLRWESLRAFCPPDSYAAGMGYATRRALQSITFHRDRGLVLRVHDPVEGEG
jgi:hypothetical protein